MHRKSKITAIFSRLCLLWLLLICVTTAALAQGTGGGSGGGGGGGGGGLSSGAAAEGDDRDTNKGTAFDIRKNYFLRFPVAREFGPTSSGGHDVIVDKKSVGPGVIVHCKSGPVQMWPVIIPCAVSNVPTKRDEGIMDDLFQTFGYPVSDTQFQVIQRYNDNRLLEQLFDPEKLMWLSNAIGNIQATSAANSTANLARNQAVTAIDKVQQPLKNFTVEGGNKWNRIRDQLFVPMAILLLLPGAVLTQVKAIIAQGTPILGDANPFDGIIRSIVAIFLIPATYLVVNYGIDVSNSLKFTVEKEYERIFGSNMYKDAQCAQLKAQPINASTANKNAMDASSEFAGKGDAFGKLESITFNITGSDPCGAAGGGEKPDETHNTLVATGRASINTANMGLTASWNVLSAFQEAYLLYLWCMGPIVAALWVWPIAPLRGALSSWIEGVVTICFWSLFWSTSVLLMACFRNVDETGTVIMTALNFLVNQSVKSAFDFSGLVRAAGASAASEMQKAASKAAQAASGGGEGGGGGPGAEGGRGGDTETGAGRSDLASAGDSRSFDFDGASSSALEGAVAAGTAAAGSGAGLTAGAVLADQGLPPGEDGDTGSGGDDAGIEAGGFSGAAPIAEAPPGTDGAPIPDAGTAAGDFVRATGAAAAGFTGDGPPGTPGAPIDNVPGTAGERGLAPYPGDPTADKGIGPIPSEGGVANEVLGRVGDVLDTGMDAAGGVVAGGLAAMGVTDAAGMVDSAKASVSEGYDSLVAGITGSTPIDGNVSGSGGPDTGLSELTNTKPLEMGNLVNAETMTAYNEALGKTTNDDLTRQAFNDVAGVVTTPEQMQSFAQDYNQLAQTDPRAAEAVALAIHENPEAGMRLADQLTNRENLGDVQATAMATMAAKEVGDAYAITQARDPESVGSFVHGLDSLASRAASESAGAESIAKFSQGMESVVQADGNSKYFADSVAYVADHSSAAHVAANTSSAIESAEYLAKSGHAGDIGAVMQSYNEAVRYDYQHQTNTAGELGQSMHMAHSSGYDANTASAHMTHMANEAHYLTSNQHGGDVSRVMDGYQAAMTYDAQHSGGNAMAEMTRAMDHAMHQSPAEVARIANEVNQLQAHGQAQDIPVHMSNYNAAVSFDNTHRDSHMAEQYSRVAEHVAQFNPSQAHELAVNFQSAMVNSNDPGVISTMLQSFDREAATAAIQESGLSGLATSPAERDALSPAIYADPSVAYEMSSIARSDAAAYHDIVSHIPEHSSSPQAAAAYMHEQYQNHVQQHPNQHPEIASGGFRTTSGGFVAGAVAAVGAGGFRRASAQSPQSPQQQKPAEPKQEPAGKGQDEAKPKETAESLQQQFQNASDRAKKATPIYNDLIQKKKRTKEQEEQLRQAMRDMGLLP